VENQQKNTVSQAKRTLRRGGEEVKKRVDPRMVGQKKMCKRGGALGFAVSARRQIWERRFCGDIKTQPKNRSI